MVISHRWLAARCPTFCQTRSTMVASGTWPSTWSPSTACCPRSASLRPSPVNQGTIVIRSGFYAVVLYCIYELDCFANLDRTSKSDTSFTVARGWTTSWSQSWGSMHEAWGLQSTRATPTNSESRTIIFGTDKTFKWNSCVPSHVDSLPILWPMDPNGYVIHIVSSRKKTV